MKQLRKILFPFSVVYDLVTHIRNLCYDRGIFASTRFDVPVICVGNLNVGGTGKSPMVEYLLNLLVGSDKVAVLSRGYGRKTKGFRMVKANDLAIHAGDEPLQIKKKFPNVHVAVCEDRVKGINALKELVSPELIVLDDAFQHRRVVPSFSILLTAYGDLYVDDLVLPAGNLRESRKGASRANVVVVTKTPVNISVEDKENITQKLHLDDGQHLFFSSILYGEYLLGQKEERGVDELAGQKVLLVTGIAKPAPLVSYLREKGLLVEHVAYKDHHSFSLTDVASIGSRAKERIVITTEKDHVRLAPLMKDAELYYLPIVHHFEERAEVFAQLIDMQREKA